MEETGKGSWTGGTGRHISTRIYVDYVWILKVISHMVLVHIIGVFVEMEMSTGSHQSAK